MKFTHPRLTAFNLKGTAIDRWRFRSCVQPRRRRYGLCAAVTLVAGASVASYAAASESRSFVLSWITVATYSQRGDCPRGENTFNDLSDVYRRALVGAGRSREEVTKIMQDLDVYGDKGYFDQRVLVNGKPANAWQNPAAERIGKGSSELLRTLTARYAYGFDLDGKGKSSLSFEDPVTHEVGVDNAYYRAVGCISTFRAAPPARSLMGLAYQWANVRSSMPAILMRITADDFTHDGDATVVFDRAIEHAQVNLSGDVRTGVTFRTDPDPRTHLEFRARLANGAIAITSGHFWMLANPYVVPAFDIRDVHLRMTIKQDGTADGLLGGYQPWRELYWAASSGASTTERSIGADLIALYRTLEKFADADPDPKTARNRLISVAYRVEAVPAFIVDTNEYIAGRGSTRQ